MTRDNSESKESMECDDEKHGDDHDGPSTDDVDVEDEVESKSKDSVDSCSRNRDIKVNESSEMEKVSVSVSNEEGEGKEEYEYESILSMNLADGFRYLSQKDKKVSPSLLKLSRMSKRVKEGGEINSSDVSRSSSGPESRLGIVPAVGLTSCVTVNFIDPTSIANSSVSSNANASLADATANNSKAATIEQPKRRGWLNNNSSNNHSNNASQSNQPNHQQQRHFSNFNLYHKLHAVFHSHYDATLNSVPYPNIRTNVVETISRIPVRSVLAGGASKSTANFTKSNTFSSLPTTSTTTTSSTSSSSTSTTTSTTTTTATPITPIPDPAEWHSEPYCHVYIAAVHSLEHYRSRVRPALQAFVSQIEGAGSGNSAAAVDAASRAAKKEGISDKREKKEVVDMASMAAMAGRSAAGGGCSSQYLIVFCPVGGAAGSGAGANPWNEFGTGDEKDGGKGGFRGRLAAGRRALSGATNSMSSNPSSSGSSDLIDGHVIHSNHANLNAAATAAAGDRNGKGIPSSNDESDVDAAAALPPGPISHSSKEVRELHRKFTLDFPNGRTCILSTLLDASSDTTTASSSNNSNDVLPATSPLQNQEWKAFQQALGDAIVCGFRDRVKRYHDELRRLDRQRGLAEKMGNSTSTSTASTVDDGSAVDAAKNNHTIDAAKVNTPGGFDLSCFFLVKESLAFTYEQMQLPGEALREYEELQAFIPEGSWADDDDNDDDDNEQSTSPVIRERKSLSDIAAAGDTIRFRNHIRSVITTADDHDMKPISHLVQQYLFARQIHLLFMLKRPVNVLERIYSNLRMLYRMRLEHCNGRGDNKGSSREKESHEKVGNIINVQQRADLEAWAVSACWDVKSAYENYFSWSLSDDKGNGNNKKSTMPLLEKTLSGTLRTAANNEHQTSNTNASSFFLIDDHSPPGKVPEDEHKATCYLGDLLSFARLRLLTLGDIIQPNNLIRKSLGERPLDMMDSWISLSEFRKDLILNSSTDDSQSLSDKKVTTSAEQEKDSNNESSASDERSDNISEIGKSVVSTKYPSPWLRDAFKSRKTFEDKYLELSGAIIRLNTYGRRYRCAARLQGEQAEILILRGEYEKAVHTLLPIIDHCANDRWDRVYSWRLFRLVSCQRKSGSAPAYLKTLTHCFGPRLSVVMPPRSSNLMQRDLEAVVGSPDVSNQRLSVSPFLDIELMIKPTKLGKQAQPLEFIRKKLVKHYCFVGDEMSTMLSIVSHLPNTITVRNVELLLFKLDEYEAINKKSQPLAASDAFYVMNVESPIEIKHGKNVYKLPWTPMTVGRYVLASVCVQWKEATFFHDSHSARRPVLGMEVLPSDPTQTIELNPLFLIPGHTQNVRLTFFSGSDIVNGGSVELICSDGLQVIPPGVDPADDKWSNTCSLDLGPCEPDSKIVLTTTVKSQIMPKTYNSHQQIHDVDDVFVQTMQARVVTSYHHGLYSKLRSEGRVSEAPPMSTLLEAVVTTLDRPALTVHTVDAFPFDEDVVIISATIHCNTPVPFFLKEWNVSFLPPLVLADGGDLNEHLFENAIAEGEELFFGFRCMRLDASRYTEPFTDERPILHVTLKDDFGKTFRQVLPLNLDSFYEQMRKDDTFSNMNTATAELKSSSDEGVVGDPVQFTYNIDLSMLTAMKRRFSNNTDKEPQPVITAPLVYNIACAEEDWILGGKVQGCLDHVDGVSSYTLNFVGIPTRAGLLKRFPELTLSYLSEAERKESSQMPPITVITRYPGSFKSLSYCNHMALACPSTVEIKSMQ